MLFKAGCNCKPQLVQICFFIIRKLGPKRFHKIGPWSKLRKGCRITSLAGLPDVIF
jgi:hypothetical protein